MTGPDSPEVNELTRECVPCLPDFPVSRVTWGTRENQPPRSRSDLAFYSFMMHIKFLHTFCVHQCLWGTYYIPSTVLGWGGGRCGSTSWTWREAKRTAEVLAGFSDPEDLPPNSSLCGKISPIYLVPQSWGFLCVHYLLPKAKF